MLSAAYVWAKVLGFLEERLTSVTTSAWLDDAEVISYSEEELVIYSPSDFRREYIRNRFTDVIHEALRTCLNSNAKLVVLDDNGMNRLRLQQEQEQAASTMELNPQFTFDTFVIGPSNRFAHGAAVAVSNTPGQVYNPLFIYGPPGVGKTHLLYAIANSIRKTKPEANIVYIKGDQFINELVDAIKNRTNVEFRNKYRQADLFLIDDIQFIAGKESTQEEFFHTFNKLYEEHKQIVMTSDRKPSDMQTLEDRLRTRFEWGLLADIQPPDYETRMAIIKNKANSLGLDLSDEVCNYIAINVTNNVRQIEGTVKKIMAYRDLNNMPLDLPNISRAITDMFKSEGNALPTPNLIINQVCKFYSLDESVIRGQQRSKSITKARQVAMYLVRKLTNLSLPDIGREFNRDHATVLYSIRMAESSIAEGDEATKNAVQDITSNINSCL